MIACIHPSTHVITLRCVFRPHIFFFLLLLCFSVVFSFPFVLQMNRHEEAVAEATRALSDDPMYTKAVERRAASLSDIGELRRQAGKPVTAY